MFKIYEGTKDLIEEKQLEVLRNFNGNLSVKMFDEDKYDNDPLDELLSMKLEEVLELVRSSYYDYIEDEGWTPEVAKVKALEDVTLWYYGDKDKEIMLRKRLDDIL